MASELERPFTATASASAGLDSLLERYHQRFEGGETIERAEIEGAHPECAAELWRNVQAWKAVARYLPSAVVGVDSNEARRPAIQFQSLEGGAPWLDGSQDTEELARRIAERGAAIRRYEVVEEIARGAMGAILRVTDLDLGRELAMKVQLVPGTDTEEGTPADHSSAAAARFVEEARLTAVLEHPGIPPVHDFGVDDLGNFYFTMPWVRGQTLREVFTAVRSGSAEWSLPRALSLLLQVSDALAYAHAQGVIHRDLKPRNVMVGEFGEAYVMDWGLARDMNRADLVDLHVDVDGEQGASDSPITTRDGVVIGTPCYMSPEQARGDVEAIGPQTDVYALGAILYELLCGHPPYAPTGSKTPAHRIVNLVRTGPPAAVVEECPGVPAELAAICSRAMARKVTERFADVGELSAELRAFLEGRVVASYAVGPWAELKKWTRRNRGVATLAGALLAVVVVGALGLAAMERSRRELVERELDMETAARLVVSSDSLGPIGPGSIAAHRAWLASALALTARAEDYETELAEFEAQIEEGDWIELSRSEYASDVRSYLVYRARFYERLLGPEEPQPGEESERRILAHELELLRGRLERVDLEAQLERARRPVDADLDREHRRLHELVWGLRVLAHPVEGKITRVSKRLVESEQLVARTLEREAEAWGNAVIAMADPSRFPRYEGLTVTPTAGLVPLGPNPAGLWEFWHVQSGTRPGRSLTGGYEIEANTGLVFILVPGGMWSVGAQQDDPIGANFVPLHLVEEHRLRKDERFIRQIDLAPFFLSKYEMTQAQWGRLTGENPSQLFAAKKPLHRPMIGIDHPVERVSWEDCAALELWSLALPTEAQWEVAARSGSASLFWWGDGFPPPLGAANYGDGTYWQLDRKEASVPAAPDGWTYHGSVDWGLPNGWGFHHMLGNVAEWCTDWYAASCYSVELRALTGEFLPQYSSMKAIRGGGFLGGAGELQPFHRSRSRPDHVSSELGVRPVFALDTTLNTSWWTSHQVAQD